MDIGGHLATHDPCQKISAAHSNGGYGRVQPVAVGLQLGSTTGDLANGATQQFQVQPGISPRGVQPVGSDPDFGVGPQGQSALVAENDHGQRVGTGDDAIPLAERVTEPERTTLTIGADALNGPHGQ
jgi:hypothetical protein